MAGQNRFQNEVDISNRALQHLRVRRITSFSDASFAAKETQFAYENLREAELRSNLWRFATRRTTMYAIGTSTLLWTPPTYSASTTYALGQVVVDSNSVWWQSKVGANLANTPAMGTKWRRYFGPDSATPFITNAITAPAVPTLSQGAGGSLAAQTYFVKVTYVGTSGESFPSGEATLAVSANNVLTVTSPVASTGRTGYNVYVSNTTGTEMRQNATTISLGVNWTEPTTGLISGVAPISSIPPGGPVGFFPGDLTSFNDAMYLSLSNNNTDTPPTNNWLAVNGTTALLQILYPIGAGPATDQTTANVYRLPHGFLRQAPSLPKGGANMWLGFARQNRREDWTFEDGYIVSASVGPLHMRFVADFVDVPDMDAMFCEMLAARIAEECGPLLVTDGQMWPQILANVQRHYRTERQKAITVNGIEIGPIDPDLDDYIACRY